MKIRRLKLGKSCASCRLRSRLASAVRPIKKFLLMVPTGERRIETVQYLPLRVESLHRVQHRENVTNEQQRAHVVCVTALETTCSFSAQRRYYSTGEFPQIATSRQI